MALMIVMLLAFIASISTVQGECETTCPYNIAQVCGSDGKTYSNECSMRAESCQAGNPGVIKSYDGPCAICETTCPYNIAYVCGSDGKTYSNECSMRAESCQAGKPGVYKVKDGKCDYN